MTNIVASVLVDMTNIAASVFLTSGMVTSYPASTNNCVTTTSALVMVEMTEREAAWWRQFKKTSAYRIQVEGSNAENDWGSGK